MILPGLTALAMSVLTLCSCSQDDGHEEFMGEMEITGKVYDYETSAGVSDIRVILSSYESEDQSFSVPLSEDFAFSDKSGAFRLKTVAMSKGWKYRLAVRDDLQSRPGGSYHISSNFDPVLHVEFDRHSLVDGVFRLDNIPVPVIQD